MNDKASADVLRALLRDGSDDQLAGFLDLYAVSDVAARLIALLAPHARLAFFGAMRQQYPECFGLVPCERPS
jgi:hypothetical protein